MTDYSFGRVQLKIMHVLWKKKRANAREITDALNEVEPIAHSTVQTLLRTLEKKGAIDHELDDRTFIFYPLVKNEKVVEMVNCSISISNSYFHCILSYNEF